MIVLVNVLVWLHIVGFALGMAGGMGMGQVGPRLAAAAPGERAVWEGLAKGFSGVSGLGLALLLITGPLVLYLKWESGAGLGPAFWIKMALVVAVVVAFGLGKTGMARMRRGDAGGIRLMRLAGPITGLSALAASLAAVFAFG